MRLKKVKNAKVIIETGKYLVNDPINYLGKWYELFGNNHDIYIEIGMGKGKFITDNALKYPNLNFIGIEKYDSVIARAIQRTNELEINNLKLIKMDAKDIDQVFKKEIALIYLNFSDPWPKERHAKRRLTSESFLQKYDAIFKGQKAIHLKTDNNNLFEYSLISLENYGYKLKNVTKDLHQDSNIDNITTEYEDKFINLGIKINRLEAYKDENLNDK